MFDLICKAAKLLLTYKEDVRTGKKPWQDPTLQAMVVAFLAALSAKYLGLNLSVEEQTAFITAVGVLARLASPTVGFKPDKG